MKSLKLDSKKLYAGAAQVDITPTMGSLIGVDFFSHYARFIHDPLFSKCLVLKQDDTTFALVMVDICIMPSNLLNDIKEKIELETGIIKEHMLLACTHTHGGGDVAGLLGGAVDINYRNQLPERIVTSVAQALKRIRRAKIASGSSEVTGYQLCRRYFMENEYTPINPVSKTKDSIKTNPFRVEKYIKGSAAPVDPEMNFVTIKGLDDTWISILANYSSHYAGDWDSDTITADFYGTFAKHLSQNMDAPKEFVAIMSYGTGGDVNTWDFRNPNKFPKTQFAKTEMMGKDLAEGVLHKLGDLEWNENPNLNVAYKELKLKIRKPTKEELEKAKELFSKHSFNNLRVDDHGMGMVYAREQILLNEYPDTHTAAIQAVKIGGQIFGAMGGELFTETGHWLKNQIKNANYFTICLANTYDGYVPPAKELEMGGYETWRARSSFLGSEAEEVLKTTMVSLVNTFEK